MKPKAIIFDCDGVLLDLTAPPYDPTHVVTPRKNQIDLLKFLWRQTPKHPQVIILTGRAEHMRDMTKKQLLNHGIMCDELIMNDVEESGGTVPGLIFKTRKIPSLLAAYDVIGMFEDDLEIVQALSTAHPSLSLYHVYA